MALKRVDVATVMLITGLVGFFSEKGNETHPPCPCEAPEFLGICDPFVPGIIVAMDERAIRVASTWPAGPADQAGVCPGDEIVAANGAVASERTFGELLRVVVSEKPAVIDLSVRRATQNLNFHVHLVRESTLAALSKQKWAILPFFPLGRRLVTVPLDESREEMEAFRELELRVGEHYGFKLGGDVWVPRGTPDDQIRRLAEVRSGGPESQRFVSKLFLIGHPYGAGFSVLLLRGPQEILVDTIVPGSPSYRAGLVPGDQLLEVDGHSVSDLDEKRLADLILKPDDHARELTLGITRGTSQLKLRLETRRTQEFAHLMSIFGPAKERDKRSTTYIFGLRVFYGDHPRQVIVTGVEYPSPAFGAGLHVGDLILAANGRSIEQITPDQLSDLLNPEGPSELTLEILRLDRKVSFRLTAITEGQAEAEIGRKMTENGPASAHCIEAPKTIAPIGAR